MDCRTSLLFYDGRRAQFLKDLSDGIYNLKSLMRKCDKYLKDEKLEEHRGARTKLNSLQEEVQDLIIRFDKSKKSMDDRIKELLGEERAMMSVTERSEVNYFLNLKKNNIESLRNDTREEDSLIKNFREFLKDLSRTRKLWYGRDPNLDEEKAITDLTLKFLMNQVNKNRNKEEPWYEVKEDEGKDVSVKMSKFFENLKNYK